MTERAVVKPSPEVPAGFGAALSRLRAARGWSLRAAAAEAGVSVTTVMRAEQGHSIQLGPAIRLASAYGVTLGALLDGSARTPLSEVNEINQGGRT